MSKIKQLTQKIDKIEQTFINDLPKLSDEQQEQKELCESSFLLFVSKAWPIIEGFSPFVFGWHAQAICEHLEALYRLEINRLIINIPPRMGKSNICAVLYCAWIWTMSPHLRFLYSSYAQTLSVRDNVKCRRLIQSHWYKSLWGHKFQLMGDVNHKLRFDNNKTGYRIASSVGGSNTGEGGHFEICVPYETMIETEHGPLEIGRIVDNVLPIKIWSYNHETEKQELQSIVNYCISYQNELWDIECTDGTKLTITGNHPIFIEGIGYKAAHKLREGDIVLGFE